MKKYVFIGLLILAFLHWQTHRPLHPPPGPLVRDVPHIIAATAEPWTYKKYTVTPVATIKLRARVLASERYYWDAGAKLSPIDLAVGWRGMSDSTYLKDLTISQSTRWYFFSYKEAPLPNEMISEQSKNVHMIPANRTVWKRLKTVRTGSVVRAEGSLVNISGPGGFTWTTYPTIGGSGEGSCWVLWVERFETE